MATIKLKSKRPEARKPQPKAKAKPTAKPAKAPPTTPAKPAGKGPSASQERRSPPPPPPTPPPAPAKPPEPASAAAPNGASKVARAAPKPGEITEQVFKGKRGGVEVTIGFDAEGNVVVVSPKPFAVVSTVDVTIHPWRNEA